MKNNWRLWLGGGFSLLALTIVITGRWGPGWGSMAAAGVSVAVFGALAWRERRRRRKQRDDALKVRRAKPAAAPMTAPIPAVPKVSGDPSDPGYLAQCMLQQGRYALLLRPQIAANLLPDQLEAASLALDQSMGIVPEGDVLLQSWRQAADANQAAGQRPRLVHVEAIYLDRYPVTNRQFQQFVDDGGYENMPLWDATIWPAVLDFVDQTGHPGPRFWSEGHYPAGLEDHPVVGVSWYEGAAYARWAGKRLPSDPEWVKAGCWPVVTQGTRPMQRRYPWGDMMDRELAHLWGSGEDGTVSVYAVPGGVSVGGIYHLIGNVWEWTTSNFGVWDATARKIETATPMKSLRGGAFDTYFETQATCQFQSGESPIQRKHNIGFRCALAMSDVVPIGLDHTQDQTQGHDEAMLASCGTAAGEERS
jgi:gamma-glutamyl hercynylcysteine S-oxide synthase